MERYEMNSIRKKGLTKISALLDLELNYNHANYNFELGLPLEGGLRKFFRPYFPNRYGFSSGYIVDDDDRQSNQTDWIIYDAEHFSPLLAQIHGIEGTEWLPYDAVYGCVEVKRTLDEKSLEAAVRQISTIRQLKRQDTTLLQFSPYLQVPQGMLNIKQGATFHEIMNKLYVGVYAFLPGCYSNPDELQEKLEELSHSISPDELPDFLAVHGQYYIRRAIYNRSTRSYGVGPSFHHMNAYITLNSKQITAGIFYCDLIMQFSNMLLSAVPCNSNMLGSLLDNVGLRRGRGKTFVYR